MCVHDGQAQNLTAADCVQSVARSGSALPMTQHAIWLHTRSILCMLGVATMLHGTCMASNHLHTTPLCPGGLGGQSALVPLQVAGTSHVVVESLG